MDLTRRSLRQGDSTCGCPALTRYLDYRAKIERRGKMAFSLPPLPDPEEENSDSCDEQSMQQEIQYLLEQQTQRIRDLEDLLETQEEQIRRLEENMEESATAHETEMQTLQDELKTANARAWETTSSANIEHAQQIRGLKSQLESEKAERESAQRSAANTCLWMYVVIGYGLLVTMFTAMYQRSFGAACQEFGRVLAQNIWPGVYLALQAPARLAHLADGIPNETWSGIIYWTVLIAVCGTSCWAIRWCAGRARQFAEFYRDHLMDWISLSVVLASLAVAVFFAGPLRVFGINAILMILIVNAAYTIVRSIRIQRYR